MSKSLSNERIILALLQNRTIRATAESLGITEQSIYNRLADNEFKVLYKQEQSRIYESAVMEMQLALSTAIRIMCDIADDEFASPQIRLNASISIIKNCIKLTEICDILPRLDALERATMKDERI